MRHRVTVEELYRLYEERDPADTRRMELIAGQIVFMLPPGALHSGYTDETEDAIRRKVGPALRVRCQHPISINRHNEPQPDIAVVKQRKDAYTRFNPWQGDYTLHSTHKGDDEVACTTIESLRLKVSGLLPAI